MRAFIAFYLGYQVANRTESFVLWTEMRSLTPPNFRTISRLQRIYTDKVRLIVERGVETGQFAVEDCKIATYSAIQMLIMVARWYNPQGRIKPTTLIGIYTNQILRMLGASGCGKEVFGGTSCAASYSKKWKSGTNEEVDFTSRDARLMTARCRLALRCSYRCSNLTLT